MDQQIYKLKLYTISAIFIIIFVSGFGVYRYVHQVGTHLNNQLTRQQQLLNDQPTPSVQAYNTEPREVYVNPADEKSQYENPFDDYKNPFDE